MNSYSLSWYRKKAVTKIRHPKWWQPFKKAELYTERLWVRYSYLGIPEDEKEVIMKHMGCFRSAQWDATGRLLLRLMGDHARDLQLEQSVSQPSDYISVEGKKDGKRFNGTRRVQNYLHDSETNK